MAQLKNVTIKGNTHYAEFKLSGEEYSSLEEVKNVLIIPLHPKTFKEELTTGRLGTSFRLMLPKRTLERYNITELPKKSLSKFFKIGEQNFLIACLNKSPLNIPKFMEEKKK